MLIVRNLLYFIILVNSLIASFQINLHLTDLIHNEEDETEFQHDCLYTTATIDKENDRYQIISYCMSEWPSTWNIKDNSFSKSYSFTELYNKMITSQELYLWSAPMDIIENYQYYLNHYSTLKNTEIAKQIFYNCTLPRFGSICQYEFEYYSSNYITLNDMIDDYYFEHPYTPTTLTCYIHLQCNRGPQPACLDWSDICDGKIDCLNDGIDEKYCWQLKFNECEDNQYQCMNGQCIPYDFFLDDPFIPDCLDRSDEQIKFLTTNKCKTLQPTFMCEDVLCLLVQHGQRKPLTSSCVNERSHLLSRTFFPNESSDSCSLVFKCIVHMPYPRDPICVNLCQNRACEDIIQKTCPDIIFFPTIPVLFGHVYFAYNKNQSEYSRHLLLAPHYICYNQTLCADFSRGKTSFLLHNSTCYRRSDLSLSFVINGRGTWTDVVLMRSSKLFWTCDLLINDRVPYCNRSTMYQCINSTKCISISQLRDGIMDCSYGDVEDSTIISNISSLGLLKRHFKCPSTNQYISYQLVGNDICDCKLPNTDLCDDENTEIFYQRNQIVFQTICDGFNELLPIEIDNRNETDETECDLWLCNNTYTHCNGIWNCFNGADEIDCDPSPLIKCPSYNHICVSNLTYQLMCLPMEKANNGIIDCLGGMDEPKLCRTNDYEEKFYCRSRGSDRCIPLRYVCDKENDCLYKEDEQACDRMQNLAFNKSICYDRSVPIHPILKRIFCGHSNNIIYKQPMVYFSMNQISYSNQSITKYSETEHRLIGSYQSHCHRGFPLRVWLDNEKNITRNICLCPPSFYGNICQYQNQRISLTIQFQALSNSWQILFSIIISLIDDTNQRIIHSFEQFSYLPMRDCQIKFNHYLLYSTRPKNLTKQYFIHIDIYETFSLTYRGSFLLSLKFPFLPVHRLAVQLNIPPKNLDNCLDKQCIHGKCVQYFNDPNSTKFCKCNQGWIGRYCTIPYNCQCSSDSLCLGIAANKRSICVCPIHKFGSRCLIEKPICNTCLNHGQCIPIDKYGISNKNFTCICRKGFSGDRCEIEDTKIIVKFHDDIILPPSILIHFIKVMNNTEPERITTYNAIPFTQNIITIYWSYPFHIVFLEFFNKSYYLTVIQNSYNQSRIIYKTLQSTDRCKHINEIFNHTIIKLHLIRRIKYYHLPCQLDLSLLCFYDDIHLCLCDNFGQQRQANCFQFDHQMKFNCSGYGSCENGAQCFQDSPTCPKTSICVCPTCFYGRQCQFSSNGFGLSLDAILGYKILPQISIYHQPLIVQISIVMTIIIALIGFINGVLSLITFSNKKLLEVGCGFYLLGSSITTLLTMAIFVLKFSILLSAQTGYINNRSFLDFQCHSIDFLLRICLHMDQWLNACVAIERAIVATQGTRFHKKKSKQIAKYTVFILLFFITITAIHDPIHRRLLDDNDIETNRIWCIITYSSNLQIYNYIINILHFFLPFILNFISAFIIIKTKARQRTIIQSEQTYNQNFHNQFQQHRHLIIAPILLVIFALPRIILTLVSGCMTSIRDSWIFLTGYFISFIPSMLTCIVFICPSKLYKNELRHSLNKYRQKIQHLLTSFH